MPKPVARVLITAEEASPLDGMLRSYGMVPVHCPLSRTILLDSPPPCVDPGLVILSSARAAELAPSLPEWAGNAPLACVGVATAEAARRRGLRPGWIGQAGAAELLVTLVGQPQPWVFVGASRPASAMSEAIMSGRVLAWPVYDQQEQLPPYLPEVDLVLLASPSAARALARCGGGRLPAIVIGETTATEGRAWGLQIVGQAARPGWTALAQAAADYVEAKKNGLAS